ncbi:3'-5' exonuclease [Lacimicrobium sp. SS2-24]|uniref:3'-5' exonuclease n=1 Tax=Lacimicrobium sp. SS2-24 TaxID=2005569 RepID=UPI000B4AA697|nr:3'-5' exonuclease [Lacimicrobium sp. SS2-24]
MQWLQRWFAARGKSKPWQEYRYLAIDLELTGLDAGKDEILSLAWVPVEPPTIMLTQRQSFVINTAATLGQSPAIHGLTRQHLQQGSDLIEGLCKLEEDSAASEDTLWLFHHAPLDMAFLRQAYQQRGRTFAPPAVVDTLALELKTLKRRGKAAEMEGLSLDKCRARYELPAHPGHNALEDAIATAELFLAYCYRNFHDQPHYLSSLLR